MTEIQLTDEVGHGVIGVKNSALEEVLIDPSYIVVSLYLASRVMAVQGKSADVLVHLLYRLQRLQHLSPFVQHVLLRTHWLPRRKLLPGLSSCSIGCGHENLLQL